MGDNPNSEPMDRASEQDNLPPLSKPKPKSEEKYFLDRLGHFEDSKYYIRQKGKSGTLGYGAYGKVEKWVLKSDGGAPKNKNLLPEVAYKTLKKEDKETFFRECNALITVMNKMDECKHINLGRDHMPPLLSIRSIIVADDQAISQYYFKDTELINSYPQHFIQTIELFLNT